MPPKKKDQVEVLPRFGRVKNNLKMGIVGLPNVGKSSLFNLIGESADAAAENFPFCTIDPNEARCPVPDERYDFLCDLWNPPSKYPAYLALVDIAGLIKGASEGAGLGNAFLSHIQAVDGLFHVVRCFESDDVVHVDDSVDPVRDLQTITGELCAKDKVYVKKCRWEETEAVRKDPKMKLSECFTSTFDKAQELLDNGLPLGKAVWTAAEIEMINAKMPGAITTKPIIYLLNISKKDFIRGGNKHLKKIKEFITENGGGLTVPFSIEFEEELKRLKDAGNEDGVKELLEQLKGRGSSLPKIVQIGYTELNLMYYFTAGEKEVRCWTIMKGVTAPQAAGVIHSDFERGFIKAECCNFEDFKELCGGQKGMGNLKAAGKYRQEGKTYVVQDGDIIFFQFNVTTAKKK